MHHLGDEDTKYDAFIAVVEQVNLHDIFARVGSSEIAPLPKTGAEPASHDS